MTTLSDLYDGDLAATTPRIRNLRETVDAPHPLYETLYADGIKHDRTAGHVHSRTSGRACRRDQADPTGCPVHQAFWAFGSRWCDGAAHERSRGRWA